MLPVLRTARDIGTVFDRIFDDIERSFYEPLSRILGTSTNLASSTLNLLDYNVKKTDNGYDIEFLVPGVAENDINVEMTNDGVLTVSIDTKKEENVETQNYVRRSFEIQNVKRSVLLPEGAEVNGADLSNGILTVHVVAPEAVEKSTVKKIPVKSSNTTSESTEGNASDS